MANEQVMRDLSGNPVTEKLRDHLGGKKENEERELSVTRRNSGTLCISGFPRVTETWKVREWGKKSGKSGKLILYLEKSIYFYYGIFIMVWH